MSQRIYNLNGVDGLVETRRCRKTGTMISIYHNGQAGLDCGCSNGPNTALGDGHDEHHNDYSTICEDHGFVVLHKSISLARSWMAQPDWCEECQTIMREGKNDRIT